MDSEFHRIKRLPPHAFTEKGSLAFSKLLLEEAQVAVAPGVGLNEHEEGFVRLGLVENKARIRQAARNIKGFMRSSGAESNRQLAS